MLRKATVFSTYPPIDASTRLRIVPLVERLRGNGWEVRASILLPIWAYRRKNRSRAWKAAIAIFLIPRLVVRLAEVGLTRNRVALVHRELFPFFTPAVEMWLRRHVNLFVIDIDDAIYVAPTHGRDWRSLARTPTKAITYLRNADLVFSGSPVERERLRAYGAAEVSFVPTCPDRRFLQLAPTRPRERILAWTGSQSTLESLRTVLEQTLRFCDDYDYTLHALGGRNIVSLPSHPRLRTAEWTHAREFEALNRAQFGLMPIPDTEWERGKSSYKALLYMSAGVIPVISPVGMNEWLADQCSAVVCVRDGDWYNALGGLAQDPEHDKDYARLQAWALENVNGEVVAREQVRMIEKACAKPRRDGQR
jgi:hypothetical protein